MFNKYNDKERPHLFFVNKELSKEGLNGYPVVIVHTEIDYEDSHFKGRQFFLSTLKDGNLS